MSAEDRKAMLHKLFNGRYYVVIGSDRLTVVFSVNGDEAKRKVNMPDAQVREVMDVDDQRNPMDIMLTMRLGEAK